MVRKKLSPWTKNNLLEIKHTLERYLAILAIIVLGVGFFSGLVITREAMVSTLNTYLIDSNMYDYRLLSTMGFDKDDYKHFTGIEGVESAEGGITIDFLGYLPATDQVLTLKAHSIRNQIGKLELIAGEFPENADEILVDSLYFSPDEIGQTIKISPENEEDTKNIFSSKEYIIVGTAKSPEYISSQRGTTNLANGSINAFIYLAEDGFDVDYYTEIYIKLEEDGFPYTDEYSNLIEQNETKVQVVLDDRGNDCFEIILEDANKEIADGEQEYEDGLAEYLSEKEKTIKELDDAYAKLIDGQNEISENEQKLLDGEEELAQGFKDYNNGLKQYDNGLAQYKSTKATTLKTLEDGQKEIDDNREKINASIQEIELSGVLKQYDDISQNLEDLENVKMQIDESGVRETYAELKANLTQLQDYLTEAQDNLAQSQDNLTQGQDNITQAQDYPAEVHDNPASLDTISQINEKISLLEAGIEEIESLEYFDLIVNYDEILVGDISRLQVAKGQIEQSGVLEAYQELQQGIIDLNEGQADLDAGMVAANQEFIIADQELKTAKSELDSAYEVLLNSQKEIRDGKTALEEGKLDLQDGFAEYEEGKEKAEDAFAKAEKELANAKIEIDDAKDEIAGLEGPTTYIFNRSHNSGYTSFDNDSSIVAGIAKVFPVFFFLVAALVCSTTMSRMVDEQRTQIGTLKSLGYSDRKITNKYVFYSGSAAAMGSVIGYFLGTKFFSLAIWTAYSMLYNFRSLEYIFDWKLAIISFLVSLLCSAGVTYISCKKELTSTPAELIRPKAPKAGKRILLEKIPAIWNKMSFLRKVSIRNVFRFKKRLLMTVMGVAGCTALIIAALGIEDSISNIANYQFDDIMTYDYDIYFKEELTDDDKNDFRKDHGDILTENVFIVKETFELVIDNKTKTFSVIATDDENITNLIDLHIDGENIPYPNDGEVVISHKLASEADASIGGTVTIKINDTKNVNATVCGIFENYVDNYIYMTENTYEMLFDVEAEYLNAISSTNNEDLDLVAETLASDNKVSTIISTRGIRDMVDDTMTSLNYVIWVVLGFAIALAFVVVYNLNNINITERTREIATLKVLGFYPDETYVYVYRENIFLTSLGILVGLFIGKGLLTFIMHEIQVDFVVFKTQIFPESYLIAIVVTFLITILVNRMLKGKIDSINMAESLNSGE